MRRLTSDELTDPSRFDVLAVLTDAERLAFLHHYFWKHSSWITRLHHLLSACLLAGIAAAAYARGFGVDRWLILIATTLAATLAVVLPLHEVIHALAFKALGARDLRWTFSLRNQIASVTAHRFVLTRNELLLVAALPSVVMTPALGGAAILADGLRPYLLSLLLLHHVGSRGDWAYLNYFSRTAPHLHVLEDADTREVRFVAPRDR